VGRYDIVKYVVSDENIDKANSITTIVTDSTISIESDEVDNSLKYNFAICDENGNILENKSSTSRSVTFSSLKKGSEYTVSVRALLDKTTVSVYSASLIKKVATSDITDLPVNPMPDIPSRPDIPNTPDIIDCFCMCHKTGLISLLWKIINFIYQIFGTNKECNCGIAHY
jgi:hypothetical protein